MEHREHTAYSGKYRGVPYEIQKGRHWTYYLYLIEEQMPDVFGELWLPGEKYSFGGPDRIMYRYDECDLITSLEWHCGCTYYSKVSGFDGDKRVVKVGCDYQHLYDEGRSHNLTDIERDVIDTVNSLYERVNVLQWCKYCGGYFQEVNERGWCADCQEKHSRPKSEPPA